MNIKQVDKICCYVQLTGTYFKINLKSNNKKVSYYTTVGSQRILVRNRVLSLAILVS